MLSQYAWKCVDILRNEDSSLNITLEPIKYITFICRIHFRVSIHIPRLCEYYVICYVANTQIIRLLSLVLCFVHLTRWNTSVKSVERQIEQLRWRSDEDEIKMSSFIQRYEYILKYSLQYWSQWPPGLRRRYAAVRLLRLWVRIPPRTRMLVCCECCVLSGRGLFDELITGTGESYRLCRVVVCDLETSWMRRPWPTAGCCAK